MIGWIKLHRRIMEGDSWLKEPFTRSQAWIDLLMLANHRDGYIRVRGVRVPVSRGQVGWSVVSLAERWKWSRGKAQRFLDELEMDQQIVQQGSTVSSLITVANYDEYQGNGTADGTPDGTADGQQTVQQTDTNKKDNNGKNEQEPYGDMIRWFGKMGVENPEGYLASLQKKAGPSAIERAWKDAKRGNGIESPAQFWSRCLLYQQRLP